MYEFDPEKMQTISGRIRYHMKERGITRSILANRCGCSKDTIGSYMNGRCREEHMDISLLKKIADCLGQPEYYFCSEYLKFLDTKNTAAFLKEKRKEGGMTQRQFAAALEIPLNNYKKYESGHGRLPYRYWKRL